MDDFRKRYDVPRRDYSATPQDQPAQPSAPSRQIPINSEPSQAQAVPAQPQYQPAAPAADPIYQAPAQPEPTQYQPPAPAQQPATYDQPAFHRPVAPAPADTQAPQKPRFKFGVKPLAIASAAVLLLLVGGGFFLFKPSKTAAVKPTDLAKQSTFDVYYPSKLPNGYIYREDLATYDNGGAYYTFVKGPKHVVIRENVTSTGKLDTNEVTNPVPLDTPAGKAIIGTNTGQTAAAVLAGQTYIFIYSNNSVPQEEIADIVKNLANIGHSK